ncbi:MAG: hypothetical protein IKP43_05365 [Bacteroidaceae bacterium]|nr:hypothetical protein [Bacteroidaceae bacterium]
MTKYIIIAALFLSPCLAGAQINDVVEVENNYVPIIRDANKINLMPNKVEQPAVHYQVDYIKTPLAAQSYVFQPLWAAKSDAITEGEGKGYAHLGYGSHGNLTGRLSYGVDLTSDDRLNFNFGIDGFNSKTDHFTKEKKWKSRFYKSAVSAQYLHRLSRSSNLIVDLDVENHAYNYQSFSADGVTSGNKMIGPPCDKQRNLLTSVSARVTPYEFGRFSLGGELAYQGFEQTDKEWYHSGPHKEIIVKASADAAYNFDGNQRLGVNVGLKNENYKPDAVHYLTYWGNPYYALSLDQWDVRLGLTLQASSGFTKKAHISPDVSAVYHATDNIDLKARLTGGERSNDFRMITALTPYWILGEEQFLHQFDQIDSKFGIEWKAAPSLTVSSAIGFDIQDSRLEMFDVPEQYSLHLKEVGSGDDPDYVYHIFTTADGNRFYGELNIDYRYKDIVEVTLCNQVNSWETDYDIPSPLRPVFDIDWTAQVKILDGLKATLDFAMQTYDHEGMVDYKRPNRYDLGAGLSYRLPIDMARITLFARGNNLLNNKFDVYNAYKAPGINVIAGAAVTF